MTRLDARSSRKCRRCRTLHGRAFISPQDFAKLDDVSIAPRFVWREKYAEKLDGFLLRSVPENEVQRLVNFIRQFDNIVLVHRFLRRTVREPRARFDVMSTVLAFCHLLPPRPTRQASQASVKECVLSDGEATSAFRILLLRLYRFS